MLGPVFWMELRTRSRRRRLFVIRAMATIGLSVVLFMTYYEYMRYAQIVRTVHPTQTHQFRTARLRGQLAKVAATQQPVTIINIQDMAAIGGHLFRAYSIAQYLLLLGIAPVYCAGCIAGDRERRVLELAFLTRLSNVELVAGKFLVRLMELCMLGVAGLPTLSLCLLLGGVSWQSILLVGGLTLCMIAFVAAASLIVSIFSARVLTSVICCYMALLIVWAGLPIVMVMRHGGGPPPVSSPTMWILALNPLPGLMSAIEPGFAHRGGHPLANSCWYCLGFYSAATIGLLAFAVAIVRRAGRLARLWPRRTRRVWSNPVAWREVKTIAVHRRMRLARILVLLLLVLISAPLWVAYLADFLERGRPLPRDLSIFEGVINGTAIITWLLVTLQGSMSFAFERDRNTLDALLTTPLSGRQIVLGKFAGILRSSTFALIVPLLFLGLARSHGVISMRAATLGAAIFVVAALLSAAWGLFCSILTSSSVKAASCALIVALIFFLGIPLLNVMAFRRDFQFRAFPVTGISPALNLDYALWELPNNEMVYRRYNYNNDHFGSWDNRLPIAAIHVVLMVASAGACLVFGVRTIDCKHRVGPLRLRTLAPRPPGPAPLSPNASSPQ